MHKQNKSTNKTKAQTKLKDKQPHAQTKQKHKQNKSANKTKAQTNTRTNNYKH